MDDKGFIFTTDAVLGLTLIIVFTASLITYFALTAYNGEEHQHLQALADSAINVMEQDGSLRLAAVKNERGNSTGAQEILNSELQTLIPNNIAYNITVGSTHPVSASDNRDLLYATDTVTKVKVISGPQEGWMGRAWYKLEEVQFEDQQQNVTTTVWNFHNWLRNCDPWIRTNSNHLQSYPYWGSGSYASPISFSIPNGASIIGGTFLLGSSNKNSNKNQPKNPSYSANVVINALNHDIANSNFTFLNYRLNSAGTATTGQTMYNYQGNLTSSDLHNGINNFYVNFKSPGLSSYSDMPWFSLLAKYTTTVKVPQGITTEITNFTDTGGLAIPSAQDLNGDGTKDYGFSYDVNTGQRTFFSNLRRVSWSNFLQKNNAYDNGVPFVLTGIPHDDRESTGACAVSQVTHINVPEGSRLFDSYLVVNSYGGVDNTLVEVWDGTEWKVAFCSFDLNGADYSDVTDGYGNNPGIIYLKDYLKTGDNKVRITVWDRTINSDYDLVGLVNCYTVTTCSKLPIQWENFPFDSHQSSNNQVIKNREFTIGNDAQQALLFVGAGTSTRHIKVDYGNSTVLYDSDTVPFVLDLAALDASVSNGHVITSGTASNYTLKNGTYNLRVTVTGPTYSWEAGDDNGWNNNPTASLFSGTRVSILYPKFLQNIWETAYASTAAEAEYNAGKNLNKTLSDAGITIDPSLIKTEAMYTGDLQNAIPVRLNLWEQ